MDTTPRCQSCAMPIGTGFYATNFDGSANMEYCKICMEDGVFREPNLTQNEMIARSIAQMIDDLHMSREKAEDLATKIIPTLKRWKK
jgi:hypothetical protein